MTIIEYIRANVIIWLLSMRNKLSFNVLYLLGKIFIKIFRLLYSGAAPMFAGMRGVHQQMLSGGTLTATSISGLGSFGHHLTTSLPTLPPDRKPSTPLSGLGPPPTSLPTPVPPPSTSTTVHSYYDHMI